MGVLLATAAPARLATRLAGWLAGRTVCARVQRALQSVSLLSASPTAPATAASMHACSRGRWNAVLFWYKLHLFGDIYLSTGPDGVAQGAHAHALRCAVSVHCMRWAMQLQGDGRAPLLMSTALLCAPGTQACAACSRRCSTLLGSCRWMRAWCCRWWPRTTRCAGAAAVHRKPSCPAAPAAQPAACHWRCLSLASSTVTAPLPALPHPSACTQVRLRFDVESSEFLHLHKPDAAFPHAHFSMLADEGRCQASGRAGPAAPAAGAYAECQ